MVNEKETEVSKERNKSGNSPAVTADGSGMSTDSILYVKFSAAVKLDQFTLWDGSYFR